MDAKAEAGRAGMLPAHFECGPGGTAFMPSHFDRGRRHGVPPDGAKERGQMIAGTDGRTARQEATGRRGRTGWLPDNAARSPCIERATTLVGCSTKSSFTKEAASFVCPVQNAW